MVANNSPGGQRSVVLSEFPSPEMKTIGLITLIRKAKDTGEQLPALYAPNATSGYVEIVPIRRATFTDWTFDEAMPFVDTGGCKAPETIAYFGGSRERQPRDESSQS